VQKFLYLIYEHRKSSQEDKEFERPPGIQLFPSRMVENCFLLQLLNGFVTEFDYQQFVSSKDSGGMFFRHLVDNCPNIRKIAVTPRMWNNNQFLPRVDYHDLFNVMATWKNLTFLSINGKGINLHEGSLKLIRENFPKLR